MATDTHPHRLAYPPTKHLRHIADADSGTEYTVQYYVAACTCGEEVVAAEKDHTWEALAAHVVEAPGGLRDILREVGHPHV